MQYTVPLVIKFLGFLSAGMIMLLHKLDMLPASQQARGALAFSPPPQWILTYQALEAHATQATWCVLSSLFGPFFTASCVLQQRCCFVCANDETDSSCVWHCGHSSKLAL